MNHSAIGNGWTWVLASGGIAAGRAADNDKMRGGFMGRSEFDDPPFLERLRQGEPAAYRSLIRRFHPSLTAVAAAVIGSQAQAEEVVQDAWLAVFSGIGKFEGRSSIVTWLFSIVLNRARSRISRESRMVALPRGMDGAEAGERGVPLSAFKPDGHWVEEPRLWDDVSPERIVAGRQLWDHVQAVIGQLPAGQRAVLVLRDMEGQTAEEACTLLKITAENQRVLLHRARSRVRQAVDALTGAVPQTTVVHPVRQGARAAGQSKRAGLLDRMIQRVAHWRFLHIPAYVPAPMYLPWPS